jgi:hypothetical protein
VCAADVTRDAAARAIDIDVVAQRLYDARQQIEPNLGATT